jgi:alcohol dehydrogenase class IV
VDRVPINITGRPSVDYNRTFSYELPMKIDFGMGISERVAERVLRDAAELSVKSIRQLSEDVGIPDGLARYGVQEERLHDLAKAGMATGNVPVNPRSPTVGDHLIGIMCRCMGNADGR